MAALRQQAVAAFAERLEEAQLNGQAINKITGDRPDLDWQDAYHIQWAIRQRKLGRGSRVVGLKMGLTSWAKMRQMGVETPTYGFLVDEFSVPDGGLVVAAKLIHPRVEAEIAVVTKRELRGPGCQVAQVAAAIDCVLPAIEVIDSRYEDFRFDLPSLIADNSSAARFTVGGCARRLQDLDLKTLGVVLEKNGEVVETGAGAAVLGHPLTSVAMLADLLNERDAAIPAGTFILTGAVTAAVAVRAGDAVYARTKDWAPSPCVSCRALSSPSPWPPAPTARA